MLRELYTPVVGDILDAHGRYRQFLPAPVQPMRDTMKVVGRAMPVLMSDVHGPQKKPFGLLTEALDDLKPGEVYLAAGGALRCAYWGELLTATARTRGAAGAVIDGYHKLYTLQWWEEDRGTDGFYTIVPDQVAGAATFNAKITTSAGAGKAFAWFTRPDGVVVGLWKNQYSALSADRGLTWTPIVKNTTLRTTGAKTWGQRTDDGRYVIVHNHSATMANRFPVTALVGSDGHLFDTILCLNGEVPPRRFRGQYKPIGPQYFRGIEEGNGHPPDGHLWIVYSMSKEDIWITRAAVPLTGTETAPLDEKFENSEPLVRWNLHLPQWAPTRVVSEPGTANHVLELRDEEPCDYALAERIFPSAKKVSLRFRVQARQVPAGGGLEIEVQSQRHDRPMRLRLNDRWLAHDHGVKAYEQTAVTPLRWYDVALDLDCEKQSYALKLDGAVVAADIPFAERTASLERIVFRTGSWRGLVSPLIVNDGGERPSGLDTEDIPGADDRAAPAVFWIDDLTSR